MVLPWFLWFWYETFSLAQFVSLLCHESKQLNLYKDAVLLVKEFPLSPQWDFLYWYDNIFFIKSGRYILTVLGTVLLKVQWNRNMPCKYSPGLLWPRPGLTITVQEAAVDVQKSCTATLAVMSGWYICATFNCIYVHINDNESWGVTSGGIAWQGINIFIYISTL